MRRHNRGDFLDRLLQISELDRLWEEAQQTVGASVFDSMLRRVGISFHCSDQDLLRIPAQGPVVLVANHPFGLADGLILGAMVSKVRDDVKFLANSLLARMDGVDAHVIPVDLAGGKESIRKNSGSLRLAVNFLKEGGLLAVFPAGEVSALKLPRQIAEPAWNGIVARLVRMTGATAVPVFFHGTNSPAFHAAGLVHRSLRTALLPRELLNKRGTTVEVAIGSPIPASKLSRPGRDAVEYLRWRTQPGAARPRPFKPIKNHGAGGAAARSRAYASRNGRAARATDPTDPIELRSVLRRRATDSGDVARDREAARDFFPGGGRGDWKPE